MLIDELVEAARVRGTSLALFQVDSGDVLATIGALRAVGSTPNAALRALRVELDAHLGISADRRRPARRLQLVGEQPTGNVAGFHPTGGLA